MPPPPSKLKTTKYNIKNKPHVEHSSPPSITPVYFPSRSLFSTPQSPVSCFKISTRWCREETWGKVNRDSNLPTGIGNPMMDTRHPPPLAVASRHPCPCNMHKNPRTPRIDSSILYLRFGNPSLVCTPCFYFVDQWFL